MEYFTHLPILAQIAMIYGTAAIVAICVVEILVRKKIIKNKYSW
jgi:hypothetical protein